MPRTAAQRRLRAAVVAAAALLATAAATERAACQQVAPPSPSLYGPAYVPGEPFVDADAYFPRDFEPGFQPHFQPARTNRRRCCNNGFTWQLLPDGLIYRSYLAGIKESRLSGTWHYERDTGWLLDGTLGGRVGILRYGTTNDAWPRGFQIDVEGAGFPRINADEDGDLDSADFRIGVPLTFGFGRWQTKLAYYHLSSHLGDEFAIRNPGSLDERINFSRDVIVLGGSYYPCPAVRLYGEVGYGFRAQEGTDPWELQFGVDISPPCPTGLRGAPFVALNGYLREEANFGGHFVAQAGWAWRGASGHLLRAGGHYFNGRSSQFQFADHEQQGGFGLWYDF